MGRGWNKNEAPNSPNARISYLTLCSAEATAIFLEITEGFLHQNVQIHFVAELQFRVPLQNYGHHHQKLTGEEEERENAGRVSTGLDGV